MKKIKIWKGGRRKAVEAKDFGTPEQQRRRIILAGGTPRAVEIVNDVVIRWVDGSEDEKKHDTTLTTCPLDVLLVRREITQDDHNACVYWLGLRKRLFGKASLGAANSNGRPDELDDKDLAKVEARYRSACRALKMQGEGVFAVTERVLVHQEWPDWFAVRQSSHWEAGLLRTGITALGRWARR